MKKCLSSRPIELCHHTLYSQYKLQTLQSRVSCSRTHAFAQKVASCVICSRCLYRWTWPLNLLTECISVQDVD